MLPPTLSNISRFVETMNLHPLVKVRLRACLTDTLCSAVFHCSTTTRNIFVASISSSPTLSSFSKDGAISMRASLITRGANRHWSPPATGLSSSPTISWMMSRSPDSISKYVERFVGVEKNQIAKSRNRTKTMLKDLSRLPTSKPNTISSEYPRAYSNALSWLGMMGACIHSRFKCHPRVQLGVKSASVNSFDFSMGK